MLRIPRQIWFQPVADSAYNAQNAQFGLVMTLHLETKIRPKKRFLGIFDRFRVKTCNTLKKLVLTDTSGFFGPRSPVKTSIYIMAPRKNLRFN